MSSHGGGLIEQLEPRQMLAVTGTRDLLYVRVRFSDQISFPETEQTAIANTKSATNWITDYSGQNVQFRVVQGAVTLPHDTNYYKSKGTGTIASDADAILKSQGKVLGNFEHVSYRYNGPIGTFGGLGQVGGPKTWIRQSSASIIAHELGHNIGLGHSKFANPSNNSDPFGAYSASEYGDPFSNMGSGGSKDWNAHEKYSRGWLGGTRTKTVSGTTAGTTKLTLTSHDDATTYSASNVYLIKVNVTSSTSYYLEYRHSPDGVLIHRASSTNPTSGLLIDAKPGTETAGDATVPWGTKIVDKRGAGTADDITFVATKASGKAQVTITVGAASATTVATAGTTTATSTTTAGATSAVLNRTRTHWFSTQRVRPWDEA